MRTVQELLQTLRQMEQNRTPARITFSVEYVEEVPEI